VNCLNSLMAEWSSRPQPKPLPNTQFRLLVFVSHHAAASSPNNHPSGRRPWHLGEGDRGHPSSLGSLHKGATGGNARHPAFETLSPPTWITLPADHWESADLNPRQFKTASASQRPSSPFTLRAVIRKINTCPEAHPKKHRP